MPTVRFCLNGRLAVCCVLPLLFSTGCGDKAPKRVPLSGKVTIGDKPLANCRVHFDPDESKGNKVRMAPQGVLNSEGQFTIFSTAMVNTETGPGLPVGWYRVWIGANPGVMIPPEVERKFTNYETTPVSIEVVENPEPDHYKIDLSKY